jgi:hypothetical protein
MSTLVLDIKYSFFLFFSFFKCCFKLDTSLFRKAPKPEAEAAARKAQYTSTGAEPGAVHGGSIAVKQDNAAAAAAASVTASMANASVSDKPQTNEKGASVIMLITSMPSTTAIEGNQITLRNIFSGKLAVKAVEVDGNVYRVYCLLCPNLMLT